MGRGLDGRSERWSGAEREEEQKWRLEGARRFEQQDDDRVACERVATTARGPRRDEGRKETTGRPPRRRSLARRRAQTGHSSPTSLSLAVGRSSLPPLTTPFAPVPATRRDSAPRAVANRSRLVVPSYCACPSPLPHGVAVLIAGHTLSSLALRPGRYPASQPASRARLCTEPPFPRTSCAYCCSSSSSRDPLPIS